MGCLHDSEMYFNIWSFFLNCEMIWHSMDGEGEES